MHQKPLSAGSDPYWEHTALPDPLKFVEGTPGREYAQGKNGKARRKGKCRGKRGKRKGKGTIRYMPSFLFPFPKLSVHSKISNTILQCYLMSILGRID